jgi:hypothetical protein
MGTAKMNAEFLFAKFYTYDSIKVQRRAAQASLPVAATG